MVLSIQEESYFEGFPPYSILLSTDILSARSDGNSGSSGATRAFVLSIRQLSRCCRIVS